MEDWEKLKIRKSKTLAKFSSFIKNDKMTLAGKNIQLCVTKP